DREEEIRKFVPVESWTIDAELSQKGSERHFVARLNRPAAAAATESDTKFEVHNEAEAQEIVRKLEGASYRVIGVEQKRRTKSSNPPYITSTMQQDASSRLRMRPFAAMRVAQQLYEGVEIEGGDYVFRANGSVLTFDGFYKVWGRDENGENELPALAQGEDLDDHGLKPEQHFTQPPPRYTEATLIKELEQRGIGRPSTYAPIVQTITKAHGYVEIKDRLLYPTRVGEAVNTLMVDHFKSISDDQYTSQLEQRLDQVES